MTASDRVLDVRERLASIVVDLTDESIATLREAVEQGEVKRPEQDKKILQARRSVEKAIRLLETIE